MSAGVVEQRTYILHGSLKPVDYLEPYERLGLPIQTRILGAPLGYFVTEFGQQNELVHLWGYEDLEDRRRRRANLAADPAWQEAVAVLRPMLFSMSNKILYPTSFSRIPTEVGGLPS